MTPARWADAYINALPETIRPARFDERFLSAAEQAHANEWLPQKAAALVAASSNYAAARNPKLVAIMRLEECGARPPMIRPRPVLNHSGCIVCPHYVRCPAPVTESDRIPPEWVAERFALIRELGTFPDMSEDEREECMRVLITDQGRRSHLV